MIEIEEKPGIIWTLYFPGTMKDMTAAFTGYQEVPFDENVGFGNGYDVTDGSNGYVALSADTWAHWDSFEEIGKYFSTTTNLPVYGIAISKSGGIDLVFLNGKQKKFSYFPLNQFDFGIQLGCRIDRLRPAVVFRNFWRSVIVLSATSEAWLDRTKIPGYSSNPCVRFQQVKAGLLIYCNYSCDELGRVLWTMDENLPDHGLLMRMFPKCSFLYLTHNNDPSNFVYAEKKGYNTIRTYQWPKIASDDTDSDSDIMDSVLGETEPLEILKKFGVPPEVLGYQSGCKIGAWQIKPVEVKAWNLVTWKACLKAWWKREANITLVGDEAAHLAKLDNLVVQLKAGETLAKSEKTTLLVSDMIRGEKMIIFDQSKVSVEGTLNRFLKQTFKNNAEITSMKETDIKAFRDNLRKQLQGI